MTSNLFKRIENNCSRNNLISPGSSLVIGLSGGPDSVFLLHFLNSIKQKYNLKLIAAHLDHGWRDNSHQDVQFCKQLAEENNITFISKQASQIDLSEKYKGSLEEYGRRLRRIFFNKLLEEQKAHLIALAHHKDDNHETFFIRLLRGAGVTGLTGIKIKDENYIHPLLNCTKQEIVQWLTKNQKNYLIDPTNQSNYFLRNRIRNHVIPALKECDSRFSASLDRTMKRLQEADSFIQSYTKEQYELITSLHNEKTWISIQALLDYPIYIQKQLILHWLIQADAKFTPSDALFNEILRFLIHHNKSSQHTFYTAWKIQKKQVKNKNYATITLCA